MRGLKPNQCVQKHLEFCLSNAWKKTISVKKRKLMYRKEAVIFLLSSTNNAHTHTQNVYLNEREIQWALQVAQHKILYRCGSISQGHILSSYKAIFNCHFCSQMLYHWTIPSLIVTFEPLLICHLWTFAVVEILIHFISDENIHYRAYRINFK